MFSLPIPLFILGLFAWIWNYSLPGFSGRKKYILLSVLALRIAVGMGMVWLYTFYYTDRQKADVHRYYTDAVHMADVHDESPKEFWLNWMGLSKDFEYEGRHFDRMLNWVHPYGNRMYNDNRSIIRTHALLALTGAKSLWEHSLMFAAFAWLGSYLISISLARLWSLPATGMMLLLNAIPSVLLWSSAPLKESLVLLQMGVLFWAWFIFRSKFFGQMLGLIALILLYYTKSYMAILMAGFGLMYAFSRFVQAQRPSNGLRKFKLEFWLPMGLILFYVALSSLMNWNPVLDMLSFKLQNFLNLAEAEQAGSRIFLPAFEPNWISFLSTLKWGLLNTILRPLPGDFNGVFVWIMLPESVAMLLLIVGLTRPDFRAHQPWFWASIWFAVGLLCLIGVTTPVLGSLFRYRMPLWLPMLPYVWMGGQALLQKLGWIQK
ncbi:MAG: hypothetical protein O3C32_04485 [Bacteroidetes bacterium]|nr:hypothetical protein [Bacteroidota bacterium]